MSRLIPLATALAVALTAAAAAGQTQTQTSSPEATTPTQATNPSAGAYDRLSPGNQKIARALYDAQWNGSTAGTGTATGGGQAKSLNAIAAMKQDGGWGQVFKQMKAQGLVQEKTLGQVVSSSNHAAKNGTDTTITTASGKHYDAGAVGNGSSGHGNGKGHGRDVTSGSGSSGSTHGNSGTRGGGHGGKK